MTLAIMDKWTDDLPVCTKSGVGFQANQRYRPGGGRGEFHRMEDVGFNFKHPNFDIGVYAVFDGHEGSAVANYAAQRVTAELMLDINLEASSEAVMKDALCNAFRSVERGYFDTIDEPLVKRLNLQIQIPEGISFYQASQRYPSLIHRLQELDLEIQGGTSALVAIVQNDHMYVANVGDSMALLCTKDKDGRYHAQKLTEDHTVHSEKELQRLANIGLDIVALQTSGGIANLETTRSLGDFRVKGGYKEYEILRPASSEPVISEPFVSEKIKVDNSCYFLALFTRGFYKAVEEVNGRDKAIQAIVSRIVQNIDEQTSPEAVAQNVLNELCREHQDQYNNSKGQFCKEREDMTLLVRLFSATLRKKSMQATPPIIISGDKAVHSNESKPPGVFPVSIPYDESPKKSEDAATPKLPKLVIPVPRAPLGTSHSSSQPPSRVSTPVTLTQTAVTPPVTFYRHLANLSEGSTTSTPTSPTNSTSTTSSLTMQSSGIDLSSLSSRSASPWAETIKPKPNVPLAVDVGESQAVFIDEEKNPLKISEKALEALKLESVESDEDDGGQNEGNQQEVQEERAPEAQNEDGKVEPYTDFSEFIKKINEAGGEDEVFKEFIRR